MKPLKYILFCTALLLNTACEDALELLPPNQLVQEEYWKTQEDVKATLMGAYKKLAEQDNLLFYYGELRGDMLKEGENLGNNQRDIMEGNIYPDNGLANYNDFYSVINYCNLVLKYSPSVKENDLTFSLFDYNAYRSEAIFLRSLAYFYLVRTFQDVPFILDPYDNTDQNFFVKKTPDDVILDSLERQLEKILTTIPDKFTTQSETRGRATRGAVYALLSDIALWNFEYEKCIEHINRLEESTIYDLVPGSDWFTIFSEGNSIESIFELQYDGINLENSLFDITKENNGKFQFLASSYAMSIIGPDKRKEQYRGYGTVNPNNQMVWKYAGAQSGGLQIRSGTEQRSCNWIVYRLADIQLMKAEALSQVGRFAEAFSIVNDIRSRALVGPAGSIAENADAYEDLIIEERAKELAYEGKRWFDLMRLGRRDNYKRKDKLIEVIIENVPATQKRVIAAKLADPNGWYLPLHSQEIENNPELVQNPYYQDYER